MNAYWIFNTQLDAIKWILFIHFILIYQNEIWLQYIKSMKIISEFKIVVQFLAPLGMAVAEVIYEDSKTLQP